MTAKRLVFTGKHRVDLEPFETAPVGAGDVLVRTRYTLMSTGTENIVFNRLFDEGTHWDKWVRYPFYPGYSAVGLVAETGSQVSDLARGAMVALRGIHASEHVAPRGRVVAVPDGIAEQDAVWFALAKIAFMGARAARCELGDSVLVIGAGPIGQMAVRWAAAAGAGRIAVVDPVAMRLEMARRGGATAVIGRPVSECRDDLLSALGGQLPGVVVDTTGHAQVFAEALGLAARLGRVVVLGDTGAPAAQHLTSDVITRGLSIVGAHDGLEDERWNGATITPFFFDLVRRSRFDLGGLNTHVFLPERAAEAYETANTRRDETMGIVFDWTEPQ